MSSGSQSKRRRIEKECSSSSSASAGSKSRQKNENGEKERLLYVFKNVSKDTVINTLTVAVQQSGEKLPSLATIFNKRGFPAKVDVLSTCTRCGQDFDPNYNSGTSCKLPHPDWNCLGWGGSPRYEWDCTSCKKAWTTCSSDDGEIIESRSDPKIAFCFVGRHTVESDPDTDSEW